MGEHRILVIEDQEDLADLYGQALAADGYRVIKAYTGEEGLAEFRDGGADLVLLDMTLPEMNGIQTLQEIRRTDASVPVVVVTGETSAETRRRCERLGVREYLSKPADHDELRAALRRELHEQKTTTEEYEVVTLRLPARVLKCLAGVDQNLERAVTRICEERFKAGES